MTETAPTAPAAPAWIRDAICWQVYPLGFCGAPRHREDLTGEGYGGADGENVVHRLPGWTAGSTTSSPSARTCCC